MNFKNTVKKNSGFSLVTVLVAVGITSIIALITMDLIQSMTISNKRLQQYSYVIDMISDMRNHLNSAERCSHNYAGVNIAVNGTTITSIVNLANTVLYTETAPNNVYENNNLRINSLAIENFVPDDVAPSLARYTGTADFVVGIDFIGLGSFQIERVIRMRVELNGYSGLPNPDNIKSCAAIGNADPIWQQGGAGKIYYDGGSVGIGTAAAINPGAMLHVAGDIHAQAYIHVSDQSLKQNIHNAKGLSAVEKLRGVEFEWKKDGTKDLGVLAQEVEKVLPELVSTNTNSGIKSVKLSNLVAVLIEATKDLHKENQKLHKRITDLEKKNKESKH